MYMINHTASCVFYRGKNDYIVIKKIINYIKYVIIFVFQKAFSIVFGDKSIHI